MISKAARWRCLAWGYAAWVGATFSISSSAAEDPPAAARLSVCVLPLQNATGNTNLDHWQETSQDMLMYQLSDFKSLRLMPSSSVNYGLRAAKVDVKSPVTPDDAMRIGRELQVSRIIWGRFSRRGENWEVSMRVGKVVDHTVSKELAATGSAWNAVVDSMEAQLLAELAAKPGQLHRSQPSLRWATSPEALELFSQAHSDQTAPAEAVEELQRAIKLDPKFAMACLGLAALSGSQGKLDAAKTAIEQALRLDPGEPKAHEFLGTLLMLQNLDGDLDGAVAELRKATDLDPDDAEAYARLGSIGLVRGDMNQALLALKAAQQASPFDFQISAQLAQVYATKGDEAQARVALADALRFQPTNHPDDNLIAGCYQLLHDPYSAVQHLKSFLQSAREQGLNPDLVKRNEQGMAELEARLTPHYLPLAMPASYTPDELAKMLQSRLSSAELALVTNPFESAPAMRAWAEKATQGQTNDVDKAKALFDAITRQFDFEAIEGFRTAREVFASMDDKSASFNCLEGAHLYVALGRAVGLKVFLSQVKRDYNDEVVGHACAAVFVGTNVLLVDPSYDWFGVPHKEVTVLDDLQAVGLDCFDSGSLESPLVLARYQIAEKLYPDCEIGIFNLLAALCRLAQWDDARKLIPQAERVNHDEWPLAAEQGLLADHDGNYDLASSFFAKASQLNPNEGKLHFLLAEALRKNQRVDEAKAEYLAALRFRIEPEMRNFALDAILAINERLSASPMAVASANPGTTPSSDTNHPSADLNKLLKAAEDGNTQAALSLGAIYQRGEAGAPQNPQEALRWYRKAAEAGDDHGEYFLGTCYEKAIGVEQDLAAAASWYRKSAEHGNALAELALGEDYAKGRGVQTNETEAEKWLVKAAESGHPFPQFVLGRFYFDHPDPARADRAVAWLSKAALQGQCDAQLLLGTCYEEGLGVAKDLAEAYKWEKLSVRGRPSGHINEDLLNLLEPSQVIEGIKRADAFQPQPSGVKISGMPARMPAPGEAEAPTD